MYGSTIVWDKLDPNAQIIFDNMRLTIKKGNDTSPMYIQCGTFQSR